MDLAAARSPRDNSLPYDQRLFGVDSEQMSLRFGDEAAFLSVHERDNFQME